MKKPKIIEKLNDVGKHDYWSLVDDDGNELWREEQERYVVVVEHKEYSSSCITSYLAAFVLNANSEQEALGMAIDKTFKRFRDHSMGAYCFMKLKPTGQQSVPEIILK